MYNEYDDITYDTRNYHRKRFPKKPFIFLAILAILLITGFFGYQKYGYLIDDFKEMQTFYSHLAESKNGEYPRIIEFKEFQGKFNQMASAAGTKYTMDGVSKSSLGNYERHSKQMANNTAIYFTTATDSYDIKKIAILNKSKTETALKDLKEVLGVIFPVIDSSFTQADLQTVLAKISSRQGTTSIEVHGIKYTFVNSDKLYWVEINR